MAALREAVATLPSVGAVEVCGSLCRLDSCSEAFRQTVGSGLKRLVLGVCQPFAGLASFRKEAVAHAGVNEGLVVCVGLREAMAGAGADRVEAGRRALEAMAAGVRRAAALEPVRSATRRVSHDVAVLGAGVSGLKAALDAAELGHRVFLVEKAAAAGGSAERLGLFLGYLGEESRTASEEALAEARALVAQVQAHPRIRLMTGAEARRVDGDFGSFKVQTIQKGRTRTLRAGAVIVATGRAGEPAWPAGKKPRHGRLISLADLSDRIRTKAPIPRRVAILLDTESEAGVTVSAAAWGAAERLAGGRGAFVKFYCRSVRVAAAGLDALYRRTRGLGVVTVKFDKPPAVTERAAGVTVKTAEGTDEFDWLVTADVTPSGAGVTIAGLRPGPAGAAQADNVWLLPVASNRLGVAVIGGARGAGEWRESLRDAAAAASLVHDWLAGGKLEVRDDAARVDAEACVFCLTCVRSCPHGAIELDVANKVAKVSDLSCRRCGVCTSVCPARAIQLPRYTDRQLAAELGRPAGVTVFACENSAFPAAGLPVTGERPDLRLIRVPCIGKVDAPQVLAAFEQGASRVAVLGCHREACRYLTGASHGAARVAALRDALRRAGLDPARLSVGHMTEFEPEAFWEQVKGK